MVSHHSTHTTVRSCPSHHDNDQAPLQSTSSNVQQSGLTTHSPPDTSGHRHSCLRCYQKWQQRRTASWPQILERACGLRTISWTQIRAPRTSASSTGTRSKFKKKFSLNVTGPRTARAVSWNSWNTNVNEPTEPLKQDPPCWETIPTLYRWSTVMSAPAVVDLEQMNDILVCIPSSLHPSPSLSQRSPSSNKPDSCIVTSSSCQSENGPEVT